MKRDWLTRIGAAALVVGAALLVGCGKKKEERPTRPEAVRETPAPGGQISSEPLTGTSIIKGVVKYTGAPKRRESLNNLMGGSEVCKDVPAAGITVLDETYIIDSATGAVKNVFVYVKNAPRGKYAVPADEKVLDQKGCVYIPHALALQTNQTLKILNSDDTTHNVHALTNINRKFNDSMTEEGSQMSKTFSKQEIFKIKCDVHSWMGAYVGVFEHPFFAVTTEDGSFTIQNLPAGEYTIAAFHEKITPTNKEVEMTVTVGEGEEKAVEIDIGG